MKNQLIFLTFILFLLTACQSTATAEPSAVQTTQAVTPDTQGDNIPDNELDHIYYLINNMELSNSNINSLPLYINLDKDSVAILKYTNKTDYTTNVTIKGITDSNVYKKIEIPANSEKEIRFSPYATINEGETSCYTIDLYCSEVNLSGTLTLQSAVKK